MNVETVKISLDVDAHEFIRKLVDEIGDTLKLALELADDMAKLDVETFGFHNLGDGWIDIETEATDWQLQRALRYIELRGEDFGYKIERDESLIRFSKKKIGQ